MNKKTEHTKDLDILRNWDKKGRRSLTIVILLLVSLSFLFVFTKAVASGEAPQESGYTIEGNSVYWSVADKFLFNVTPHTAHCKVGKNCTQIIQVKNLAGGDLTANVAFVFNEKPVYAGLEKGNWLPPENGNVTRTMTQSGVTSLSATDDACEIGNSFNIHKKQVDYTINGTDPSKIVCYNTAIDLGDDTWQIDYWVTEQVIGWHFEGNDVTHLLDKGTHGSKYYGAYEKTFSAGETEYYRITYTMNSAEPEDEQGRRKWEFWGWEAGETPATASWIVKLDPWSINPSDYLFYDTGDKKNNSYAAQDGEKVVSGTNGWTTTGTFNNSVYDTTGDIMIGNTSFMFPASARTEAHSDFPSLLTDVTFQCAYYSNLTDTAFDIFQLYDGVDWKLMIGKKTSEHTANWLVYPLGEAWTDTTFNMTQGWINWTVYLNNSGNMQVWFGADYYGSIAASGNESDSFRLYHDDPWPKSFWDECFIWEGPPSDRPSAITPTISYVQFNQTSYRSEEDITVSALVFEPDLDNMTVNFTWSNISHQLYVESFTNQVNGTIVNATLGSANTTSEKTINVTVWISDGAHTAEDHNSTTITTAAESEGRTAIESGIAASTASSGTIYTDQQVYIRYLNGTQKLGTFDKVLIEGSQRWLFNYNTTGESYTNMEDIAPVIYVWENTSLTTTNITHQVSGLINTTDN